MEAVITTHEDKLFSHHKKSDWRFLYQQIRDPNETSSSPNFEPHSLFYEQLDDFVSTYLGEIDPTKSLGLYRPTSHALDNITKHLAWKFRPNSLGQEKGSLKYGGWIYPKQAIDLMRRFVARELLHNSQIQLDRSSLHIRPGDPSLHKQFYRRPGISLKLAGTQTPITPSLSMARIFMTQSKQAKLESTTDFTTIDNPTVVVELSDQKYSVPIVFHSTLKV